MSNSHNVLALDPRRSLEVPLLRRRRIRYVVRFVDMGDDHEAVEIMGTYWYPVKWWHLPASSYGVAESMEAAAAKAYTLSFEHGYGLPGGGYAKPYIIEVVTIVIDGHEVTRVTDQIRFEVQSVMEIKYTATEVK